ncbi:MAG TPA: HD domain-containing protein [Candidatus Paceibacterota bacterium]|nr:HD domain-containing protein [Candidatus Paceibacterota bacterium]
MTTIKRDIELLFEIGCFRFSKRTWQRFLNPDVANCAEHTLRVIWIALTIARHENKEINMEKLLKFALVHDKPESRTGDVDYLSRQYTKRDEEKGAVDMFNGTVHEDQIAAFIEYEKRECWEAKIVKDADNIDVELELVEQEWRGHTIGTLWNDDRKENVFPKLYTETAKILWEEIHKANPHDWHLNAQNRFKAGDWKK